MGSLGVLLTHPLMFTLIMVPEILKMVGGGVRLLGGGSELLPVWAPMDLSLATPLPSYKFSASFMNDPQSNPQNYFLFTI